MSIASLTISRMRNIGSLSLQPCEHFNVFHGENGSGKTSILEAIYYLGLARSFRTHLNRHVIQDGQDSMVLAAKLPGDIPVGLERTRAGDMKIRINSKQVKSSIELAEKIPLLLLNTDSYQLLTGGPVFRRRFMDWGVFHVEHSFLGIWKQYQQCVKQRNAELRMKSPRDRVLAWDQSLVRLAEQIDQSRSLYMDQFRGVFSEILSLMLDCDVELRYSRGWRAGVELEQLLFDSVEQDMRMGYTQLGAHRADFKIVADGHPASHYLSRGQQKRLLFALKLAQGKLLQGEKAQSCIYLIDDLAAELDSAGQQQVAEILGAIESQVYITCLEVETMKFFEGLGAKVFHVEHGDVV